MEFNILFDTHPIPTVIISMSKRRIIYANRAAVLSFNFPSGSTYERLYTYESTAIDTLIKLSARTNTITKVNIEEIDYNGDRFVATVDAAVICPQTEKMLLCFFSLKAIETSDELQFLERVEFVRQLVNEIGQSTYHIKSMDENLQYILGVIGPFAEVSRAYIVEYNNKTMSCTYEWHSHDEIPAARRIIYELPIHKYTFDYEFINAGIYYSNDTSSLSEPDKSFMDEHGIKAVMYIPLFDGNKIVGFLGFDLLDSVRKWDDLHISAFQNIANIISTIIYRKNAEQKLNFYAKFDILTGIYNRRWGEKLLTEVLNSETRLTFVLCFIDMDKLKYINDTFGHDSGDYAIKKIVGTINKYLSVEDVFSRYGGDEFLLMLPRKNSEYAGYLFENVMTELGILSKNLEYELSISYGYIETNNYTNLSISELIYIVDEKMYEQKMSKKVARL